MLLTGDSYNMHTAVNIPIIQMHSLFQLFLYVCELE